MAFGGSPATKTTGPCGFRYSVPISFAVQGGRAGRPGTPGPDSLDLPSFTRLKLPTTAWDLAKAPPADKGVLYGSCLQRLGFSSGGLGQYVRLVNLSTGQVFRINVKPAMRSRRENGFCYALPAGRYALSQYEYSASPFDIHAERLLKAVPTRSAAGVAATRYVFVLLPGQRHYVGTWNFVNADEPIFLDEKDLLDPTLRADQPATDLATAHLALPH